LWRHSGSWTVVDGRGRGRRVGGTRKKEKEEGLH